MSNQSEKFTEVKNQIRELIKENLHREVTSQTKYNKSGIYMIYIDHWEDNKIIPFYIGQSKDIQTRYKKHYTEILALNRLSSDEYKKYFFKKNHSFYEGVFKTPKIFKYMLENQCKLKDFHMIILEEIDETKLVEREQYLLTELLSSFFGFNQFNTLLKKIEIHHIKEKILKKEVIYEFLHILNQDMNNIEEYYSYGFTRFNFEHSLVRDLEFLIKRIENTQDDTFLHLKQTNKKLDKILLKYINNHDKKELLVKEHEIKKEKEIKKLKFEESEDNFNNFLNKFDKNLEKSFRNEKLYSRISRENFIKSILTFDNTYKENFNKYIATKKTTINFYNFYQKEIQELLLLKEEVKKIKEEYIEAPYTFCDYEKIKRYRLIFPDREFESFSLHDNVMYNRLTFDNEFHFNNTCHIKFYISSNNRSTGDIDKVLYVFRVDYTYINDYGEEEVYVKYIHNEIATNSKLGNNYLCPDFYNIFAFKPNRFKVSTYNNNVLSNTFISILSEYKHGINDYTIQDKELYELSEVLIHIQELTNASTRYKLQSTESFPNLEIAIKTENFKFNPFIEKLVKNKLPKLKKLR